MQLTLRGYPQRQSYRFRRAQSNDTLGFKIDLVVEKLFQFFTKIGPKAPRGVPRKIKKS